MSSSRETARERSGETQAGSPSFVGRPAGGFPSFPAGTFDIIYADPPWDYKGQLQHAGPGSADTGGAVRHYSTVRLSELKKLDVKSIAAEDSLLFMWATSPHLDQAIELGKSWTFDWATVAFVWDKGRVNPGHYTISQCELCLLFKRGRIPQPRGARNVRQLVSAERGSHSAKPEEVRKRIERMFPQQSRIELFARGTAPGWRSWGLEANRADGRGCAEHGVARPLAPGRVRSAVRTLAGTSA